MNTKKIMLVDDEPITNFINRRILEKHGSTFDIKDFTDPKKAFESIPEFSPDIIFLDINMPLMDGWSFLESMAASSINTPVIMLSSSTDESDISKSRRYANVKHFSTKPLNIGGVAGLLEAL